MGQREVVFSDVPTKQLISVGWRGAVDRLLNVCSPFSHLLGQAQCRSPSNEHGREPHSWALIVCFPPENHSVSLLYICVSKLMFMKDLEHILLFALLLAFPRTHFSQPCMCFKDCSSLDGIIWRWSYQVSLILYIP